MMAPMPARSAPVPSSNRGRTVTVGQYLATRLWQLGCHQLFGVPGEFSLGLLDEMLTVPGVGWVACSNELNAAYAADGYARTRRGIGSVVTSHGVGELSSINGVAGSYTEYVPVVQITGLPSTPAPAPAHDHLRPHGPAAGDPDLFLQAYREVTAAGAVVNPGSATNQIDRILRTAIDESRPVYLGIPTDVAGIEVPADDLLLALHPPHSDPDSICRFRDALRPVLDRHSSVTILAGGRLRQQGLEAALSAIADLSGVGIATQVEAKAMIGDQHPAGLGTYLGTRTRSEAARAAVDHAPLLVLAGASHGDSLSGMLTPPFRGEQRVELSIGSARIGAARFADLRMQDAIWILCDAIEMRGFPPIRWDARPPIPGPVQSDVLTRQQFWARIQQWLPNRLSTVADLFTVLHGGLELQLPDGSEWLVQPACSSVGYALPAALGVCEAGSDRRSLLLIGDGAAQPAIQELGTILQRGHTPIVVLITTGPPEEPLLHNPDTAHRNPPSWDWTALATAFWPGVPLWTSTVRTGRELGEALDQAATRTDRAAFIEAVVHRDPPGDRP
jgi:TPP-dependent 2-oxoacid decarboxylase